MIPKPIGQIGTVDLQALVADAVAESKTIEYKQEMPGGTREEKIKSLAAVSSFANTAGGDLLIGVPAQDGIPTAVSGIAVPSIDDEKLRLESLLADCIEPRIPRIEIAAVPCSSGQHALVVRAHRSWLAPHRVKLNDKFYGRNSAGKYPLDVSELRSAFVLSETATERIRAFRAERLIKITARENFIGLPDGPVMVIHAVPFAAFATGRQIDPYETLSNATVLPMPPTSTSENSSSNSPITRTTSRLSTSPFRSTPDQPPLAGRDKLRAAASHAIFCPRSPRRAGPSIIIAPEPAREGGTTDPWCTSPQAGGHGTLSRAGPWESQTAGFLKIRSIA
jgi:Putative DNA-binding domain